MKYRAIGFDYGGVVKGSHDTGFLAKTCSLLDITPETFRTIFYRHNRQVNLGKITWEGFWDLFVRDAGKPEKLPEVLTLFAANAPKDLNKQVLDLVGELRKAGYKVGLLSNNTHEVAQEMRDEHMDQYFDVLHVSAETGFVKPEAGAFEYFAKALGVDLSEMVFIDDSPNSISLAHEVGFTAIQFKGYEDLVGRLQALDVKV